MFENSKSTGERLETFIFNKNTFEHLHRYGIASKFINGKIVLDIASGEGYGTNILSKYAAKVYGVDIDVTTINNAKKKYQVDNIEFLIGSSDAIPLESSTIDVIVSFETLEHHDKHHEMMKEIKRVLKPSGILIMSTPEKKNYSELTNFINPFHIKELYFSEFKELVQCYFAYTEFLFQTFFRGSLIIPQAADQSFEIFEGDYDSIHQLSDFPYMYNIVVASDSVIHKNLCASAFMSLKIDSLENMHAYENILNSWSYRLGNLLLLPFKIVKKIFKSLS